ncbi:hypothetical protein AHAS_Ahas20G0087400 [Arachis hypogaea]
MVTSVVNEENLWLRWPSRKRQPVNDTWPERGRRPYPLTLLTYGEIANGVMGSIFSSELSCEWWGEGHLRRPLLEMDSLRKVSEKVSVVGGGDLTRQQHQNQHIRRHLGEKSENPRLCFIIAFPLSPSVPLCLCLSRLENLNPGIRRWLPASSSGPHLFSYLLLAPLGIRYTDFVPNKLHIHGMCESELDLADGSIDEYDSNKLEELHTDEGDSRHVDSEYQDCNGGGCNVDASTEDHGNSGNIIGEQFNSPYPVNGSVLLSAKFTGVEDAYTSYVAYTKDIGFAVRKGDSQGLQEKKHYERVDRKRPYKPETRTNCNAKLVVFLDKSCGKWRTKALVEEHNHDLASPTFTNVITLHRKITEGHKAHIHSMHEAGFQTTQMMGFFAYMCGGYRNLNFISKDLYNYMDGVRQSRIVERDAAAEINYLKARLSWIQWQLCNIRIALRSTLVTCFDLMDPKVIVTDGDESMREAIRSEFSNAAHRLCTWHLARNAIVNIKDKNFCATFETAIDHYGSRNLGKICEQVLHEGDILRGAKTNRGGLRHCWSYTGTVLVAPRSSCLESFKGPIMCTRYSWIEVLISMHALCKDAKVAGSNSKDAASDPTGGFCVRYGALWSAFLSMCFQDAQTTETYNTPMTEVARMSREFESICGIGQSVHRVQAGVDQIHIRYPKVIRSKGAPRGSMNGNNGRHYQRCFRLGHD